MNIQRIGGSEPLSLYSALLIGLAVSTGHPTGLAAAGAMPLACMSTGTRTAAFKGAFAYYSAALWPIIPGLTVYWKSATPLIPPMLWIVAAILLSLPWTLAWSARRVHCVWRTPLALLATILPPLGVIGLASPITGAGYLFPGTGWAGLAIVALLPGILLSMHSLRKRTVIVGLVVAFCVASHIAYAGDAEPPRGWTGINTQFGDLSQSFRDFEAAQFIQRKADQSSDRVLIFPEALVPRWSEATERFWHRTLDRCRMRGQILAIGAGLPSRPTRNERERLSDLRSYDFRQAIEALKGVDVPAILAGVSLPAPEPIDNTMLVVGAESGTFYQRVPVPLGMWRPFDRLSVPLRLNAPGVLAIDHQRAAVLICYEQMLTFPMLTSMLHNPTVIVGISNTFWVVGTTIPRYQDTAILAWSKLFHLPYLRAINS